MTHNFIRVMNKTTKEVRDLTEEQYNRFFDNRDPYEWSFQRARSFTDLSPEEAQELLEILEKSCEELDDTTDKDKG